MSCTLCSHAHACKHIPAHSFVAENHVDWFVHKPMTFHPSYSQHFLFKFLSVVFPFLSFLVASVHLFILSIRKKKPLFLPPQARDDGGLGGKLPQHSFTQDTPRLVFKTNSDVLVRTKTIEHQIEFKLNGYCTNMFWCYLLLKVYNFQATSSWHVKRLFHIWPLM